MLKNNICGKITVYKTSYTRQFRLVYTDVEKRWMRRFKSNQIKAFSEKLCVGAATTKVNLHRPVPGCRSSPHLNLHCQVSEAPLQVLPTFLASSAWGLPQLCTTSRPLCTTSLQLLDASNGPYGPNSLPPISSFK